MGLVSFRGPALPFFSNSRSNMFLLWKWAILDRFRAKHSSSSGHSSGCEWDISMIPIAGYQERPKLWIPSKKIEKIDIRFFPNVRLLAHSGGVRVAGFRARSALNGAEGARQKFLPLSTRYFGIFFGPGGGGVRAAGFRPEGGLGQPDFQARSARIRRRRRRFRKF